MADRTTGILAGIILAALLHALFPAWCCRRGRD